MDYISQSSGSSYYPKLLGTYEKELHESIARIRKQQPNLIVDIGAAEGYYAVGLAMLLPEASVLTFDIDGQAREHLRKLAERNGVTDRVQIDGRCSPEVLEAAIAGKPRVSIICDVEGYETELLDLETVPSLRQACILVETHPHLSKGIEDLIHCRFSQSHKIERIECLARGEADFDQARVGWYRLPDSLKRSLVIERGPLTPWLYMTPR
jgi:hypothetical protein